MFSCAFVGSRYVRDGLLLRSGIIVFDDNVEVFESPLVTWNEDDYERAWEAAINLITGPQPINAAIITGFNGVDATYIHWWPLYPIGDLVVIRDQYLMLEKIRHRISDANLFDFVPERNLDNPDGKPSEWIESVAAFSMFGHCLKVARATSE